MKTKYYMHELIEKYYKRWINSPTLIGHINDRERFYQFVKACVRYSKHWNAKQDIHTSWLRHFLEEDLRERYNEQYLDEIIHKIVSIFEHILEFSETSFPDHYVEMKNPILVHLTLRSWIHVDVDGTRKQYYTDEEIERIMAENFGPNWRIKYGLV